MSLTEELLAAGHDGATPRSRALECAERSDVTRSVMWSLVGILDELTEIRRELKRRR